MIKEKQTLEAFISMSKSILSSEGRDGVEHYLEHGEYEMSFEGLVIELYTTRMYPPYFDFAKWKELGLAFGLDKESVFDEKFWDKFNEWGQKYTPENL
ncbi:hypothetical protein [Brevibacillus reuszeri]|uniref:hypothetical protein n=1 Tax=Brevibacillus reuszeri TaxID=54915 RepID=UPI002899E420|nr:hypothetical protein [Brevibacillus reuszeri]